MVVASIRSSSLAIGSLLLMFIAVCGEHWHQQALAAQQEALKLLGQEITAVNLKLAHTDWGDAISKEQTLGELELSPVVVGGELLDSNNRPLSRFGRGPEGVSLHFFYLGNGQDEAAVAKIYFRTQTVSFPILDTFIVSFSLFTLLLIVGTLAWQFNWTRKLESYAAYILNGGHDRRLWANHGRGGLINQALNQLLLNNRLLSRDKADLTDQIRKTSYVDEVTGLGNQWFFKAEFEVRLHSREESAEGLLMLLSFVEDDHEDEAFLTHERLIDIANLLRGFIQTIPNSLTARLKAGDFALLLPNQPREKIDRLCKTLVSQLGKMVFDNSPQVHHFVDIGISAYKHGFDYYKVMAEADMALRNSQLQGGNSWYIFGEVIPDSKVRGSLRWRTFLQAVLDRRQVQLFAQQIHYFSPGPFVKSGDVIYHQEILARIDDGTEILGAEVFLPMANQCGLAEDFDRQIIDSLLKHLVYQQDNRGTDRYSFKLFISSLLSERFIGWLTGKLSSYPERSRQLIIEIPEAHIDANLSYLQQVMPQIESLGVSWCIEHFGAPHQDLSYLQLLPISMVKIDRRVINNIYKQPAQQLLLKTLQVFLNDKEVVLVAEGVEQEADLEYLRGVRIDAAQGYYFDKPHRLKQVEAYLKVVQ